MIPGGKLLPGYKMQTEMRMTLSCAMKTILLYISDRSFLRKISKKTMKITNIKWDTDGDVEALEALPEEVTLPADEFNREDYMEDGEFNEDAFLEDVSDWLSDTYEFCHDGFSMEGEDEAE